jgi:hypothetical protein
VTRHLRDLAVLGALAAGVACGQDVTPRGNGDGGADSPQQSDVTGLVDGALVLDKVTVNLGGTGVASVTLTNTADAPSGPVTISTSADVTATGCNGPLAAGASCIITITGTPTAAGTFSGTVSITADPGAVTPLQISLINTWGGYTFSASPGSFDFGDVPVGIPAPQQTITVTAGMDISDLAAAATGPDVTIDEAATTCTATLARETSCIVVFDFTAATAGNKSDSILISGGGASGKTVTVVITAVAARDVVPLINPSTPQTFAAPVGQTSPAITFGLVNTGDGPTGVISVAVTGSNAANFDVTSDCLILVPLSGCTISVTYTPTSVGPPPDTAQLVVTDTAVSGYSITVPLSGVGVSPANLVITPESGDLGAVLVGQAGPSTVFTVTNTGDTASGNLTVALSSTEFIITKDTSTGASLVGNTGTCTISITFSPVTCGTKSATLTVAGTNGSPGVKTLTGLPFSSTRLGATPAAVDFGSVRVNRTSAAQTVTAKLNGCGGPTGPLSFAKAGSFGEFSMTANTCSAALNQGESCTFVLVFAPTAPGTQTASFTLTDGTASATVLAYGNGLDPVPVTLSPAGGVFPDTVVGQSSSPLTFTLTNSSPSGVDAGAIDAGASATDETGAIAVSLAGSDPSDFQITSNGCAASLPPQATCQIAVAFTPHATSSRAAELAVTTDNGGLPTAALSGTGI